LKQEDPWRLLSWIISGSRFVQTSIRSTQRGSNEQEHPAEEVIEIGASPGMAGSFPLGVASPSAIVGGKLRRSAFV
jgi:hypothetical protein